MTSSPEWKPVPAIVANTFRVSGVGDRMIRITFGEQVGKSAANTMFHMAVKMPLEAVEQPAVDLSEAVRDTMKPSKRLRH